MYTPKLRIYKPSLEADPKKLLPQPATASDTLRYNGVNWIASSVLKNDGTNLFLTPSGAGKVVSGVDMYATFANSQSDFSFSRHENRVIRFEMANFAQYLAESPAVAIEFIQQLRNAANTGVQNVASTMGTAGDNYNGLFARVNKFYLRSNTYMAGISLIAIHSTAHIDFFIGGEAAANEMARMTNVGFGIKRTTVEALVHLGAGSSSVPPLIFTSATATLTAKAGAFEYNGVSYLLTDNSLVRRHIVQCQTPTKTSGVFVSDGYITVQINGTSFQLMTTNNA